LRLGLFPLTKSCVSLFLEIQGVAHFSVSASLVPSCCHRVFFGLGVKKTSPSLPVDVLVDLSTWDPLWLPPVLQAEVHCIRLFNLVPPFPAVFPFSLPFQGSCGHTGRFLPRPEVLSPLIDGLILFTVSLPLFGPPFYPCKQACSHLLPGTEFEPSGRHRLPSPSPVLMVLHSRGHGLLPCSGPSPGPFWLPPVTNFVWTPTYTCHPTCRVAPAPPLFFPPCGP